MSQIKEVSLKIENIDCAACVERLNASLNSLAGVEEASVNYAISRALISYDSEKLSLKDIVNAVKKAGYDISADSVELLCSRLSQQDAENAETLLGSLDEVQSIDIDMSKCSITLRLWPVNTDCAKYIRLLRSIDIWAEAGEISGGDAESLMAKRLHLIRLMMIGTTCTAPMIWDIHHIAQFILATAVQIFSGSYFYKSAFRALRNRTMTMDVLVSISTTAIYLYSTYQAFFIPAEKMLYFMSGSVLITLLLFGKYLELIAMGETANSIKKLMRLQPKTAVVERGGTEKELPIDEIEEHDVIIIRPGERIPVDGIIIDGSCSVDESLITGESMPADKEEGDRLVGGTLNRSGSVRLAAEGLGKDSYLHRLIDMVQRAQTSKAPIQRIADKIASFFVPLVLITAVAVFCVRFFILFPGEVNKTLNCVCSLLVIACPCALGLATPTSIMVGAGRAAELGVMFRGGAELENTYKTDTVIFDKTGTLTFGRPEVTGELFPDLDKRENSVIYASALERMSQHPVSVAVCTYAAFRYPGILPPPVDDFREYSGRGVCGVIEGKKILCGNRQMLSEHKIDVSSLPVPAADVTELCIAIGGELTGALYVSDKIRPWSKSAVENLKNLGIDVWLLTGDNMNAAFSAADKCGIPRENVLFSALPEDKEELIRRLQKEGRTVCMVGDGINDAPSLAAADVSIAMGSGTDIAIDSAGIILPGGRIENVVTALCISRATVNTIRLNLLWALFYNLICIPAAAAGIVNPAMAAAAMSLSSNAVLLNSLRLQKVGKNKREKRNS